jgi:sialidase-1
MQSFSRRSFFTGVASGATLAAISRLDAQPDTTPASSGALKDDDGLQRQLLRPFSALNPKNSEGSGVMLKDGSVLLLWTEFMDVDLMPEKDRPAFSPLRKSLGAAPNNDDGYARISGAVSKDGGKTWSAPRIHADDADARVNTMSPALARLKDGRLMLAYSWRSGGNHADNYGPCARRARFSSDEGATWSDPVRLTPDDGTYHTGCHDRAWVLPSGRILVQCHTNSAGRPDGKYRDHKHVYLAWSDDAGKTWKNSNRVTEPIARGLNEACLVPRRDGSLLMVLRSWRGHSYLSESKDEGATWSDPRPSGIIAPDAPTFLTRVPGTSDILMIWNCNFNLRARHDLRLSATGLHGARTVAVTSHAISRCPLLCAISRDDGRTWGLPKVLEDDINYEWAYPGVIFHGDTALIHYFRSPMFERRRELMLTHVPIKWLYDDAS